MTDCSDWIGRQERRTDRIDPALATRWLATFDLPEPANGIMPPGIHFCLCTPDAPTAQLGADGHPLRDNGPGGFLPPIPLPRRMWAASAIVFHAPLAIGQTVERISTIASITQKTGNTGPLAFVEIDHATSADGTLAITERQTLVYRDAAAADAPLQPPAPGPDAFAGDAWDRHRTVTPDARSLFRYSALTFNTHRIHYDAPYARDVERYRGLVVHGPLIASLAMQMTPCNGDLRTFAFRALSPAIADEPLHLVTRDVGGATEFGAFTDDGRQTFRADATFN
ncbi:MAG: MaoC family dehydratase N-terminal domain-containing protein [Pontixanthobacter sp.]